MTAPYQRDSFDTVVGDLARRVGILEAVPIGGVVLEIKIFPDASSNVAGASAFIFAISRDLNGFALSDAQAYVSSASASGLVNVQVRNSVGNMLSTPITIDVGEFTSYTAATPSAVGTNSGVATGDLIAIDVNGAGIGARGLGVILVFT